MLTFPLVMAAAIAGLIGGFHCIGMCGGISHFLSQIPRDTKAIIPINLMWEPKVRETWFKQDKFSWFLHAGRLLTYMLIGAVFGGLGAGALAWKNDSMIPSFFYFIGNLFLVLLGLKFLGFDWQTFMSHRLQQGIEKISARLVPTIRGGGKHPLLLGLGWGAFPCGLSYAIAPFAILSGAAWSGALLMLVFGLSALPHLLITQSASRSLKSANGMKLLKYVSALLLIAVGLFGLFYADMNSMPDFLCIVPRY